ncbi:DUF6346 domain-containing protein [Amycolatopsis pittospori]|uniref:DUF6346 domain-containing protein n=1 Tax=Amycolatopsis pittospori TaxID=2749434 RepID=UPI0015EFDD07|nr:DUF6346 domain-containing protein [Amycolatopsis pittospori]
MTEPAEREGKRSGRFSLKVLTGVVFAVVVVWFMASLGVALGVRGEETVERFGVAHIQDCERSATRFWLVHACRAEVTWDREVRGKALVTSATVASASELSGDVDVVSMESVGRRGTLHYTTLPADRPQPPFSFGWLLFFLFVSAIPGFVAGWFAGKGIGGLLPEPKEKPKDWRGVGRRDAPGTNGRRRKR